MIKTVENFFGQTWVGYVVFGYLLFHSCVAGTIGEVVAWICVLLLLWYADGLEKQIDELQRKE